MAVIRIELVADEDVRLEDLVAAITSLRVRRAGNGVPPPNQKPLFKDWEVAPPLRLLDAARHGDVITRARMIRRRLRENIDLLYSFGRRWIIGMLLVAGLLGYLDWPRSHKEPETAIVEIPTQLELLALHKTRDVVTLDLKREKPTPRDVGELRQSPPVTERKLKEAKPAVEKPDALSVENLGVEKKRTDDSNLTGKDDSIIAVGRDMAKEGPFQNVENYVEKKFFTNIDGALRMDIRRFPGSLGAASGKGIPAPLSSEELVQGVAGIELMLDVDPGSIEEMIGNVNGAFRKGQLLLDAHGEPVTTPERFFLGGKIVVFLALDGRVQVLLPSFMVSDILQQAHSKSQAKLRRIIAHFDGQGNLKSVEVG